MSQLKQLFVHVGETQQCSGMSLSLNQKKKKKYMTTSPTGPEHRFDTFPSVTRELSFFPSDRDSQTLARTPSPTYTDTLDPVMSQRCLTSGIIRALWAHPLWHPPRAVQRHSGSHRGHRQGDGVDEAALLLHPHLTGDLPLPEQSQVEIHTARPAPWDDAFRTPTQSVFLKAFILWKLFFFFFSPNRRRVFLNVKCDLPGGDGNIQALVVPIW